MIKDKNKVVDEYLNGLKDVLNTTIELNIKGWRNKDKSYFYTSEPIIVKERKRYISGIQRYVKSKKKFTYSKVVYLAKKKKAIERARRLYENDVKERIKNIGG